MFFTGPESLRSCLPMAGHVFRRCSTKQLLALQSRENDPTVMGCPDRRRYASKIALTRGRMRTSAKVNSFLRDESPVSSEPRGGWDFSMALYMVEKLVSGVLVLDLRGRVTLGEETEALRERIKRLVGAGHARIVLNLGEVSYIDSVGLSTLVASYTSARRDGGDLKLLHLTKRVHDLLQITRLSTVFEMYDSLEAAVQSFEQQTSP